MAQGTLKWLGLKASDLDVGETTFTVDEKKIKRPLYPGGPEVEYTRPAQTITRVLGAAPSTAKSGDQMTLSEHDAVETIRVTGSKRLFAKWLKSKVSTGIGTDTLVLKNKKGSTYAVLREGLLT